MSKKHFPLALCAMLFALSLPAQAQQAKKVYRVGYLAPVLLPARRNSIRRKAFREGLRELGYVEGQNLVIEYRSAEGKVNRIPDLVAELVRLNVDVIFVHSTPAVKAVKKTTTTLPIVTVSGDPVRLGFVASLAHPGGNITGLANLTPELIGKSLELFKEVVPQILRVAVLWDPDNPGARLRIREATKSREITEKGLSLDYYFELRRLLVISPAITEAVVMDFEGVKRLAVSRFTPGLQRSEKDHAASPAFKLARQGKSYFSPVYFVRGSEPYMTIAVPIERYAGRVIGVLQAEVNLKYVWEVVSNLKVGNAGYAYAVARNGDLIAHPDISLVL